VPAGAGQHLPPADRLSGLRLQRRRQTGEEGHPPGLLTEPIVKDPCEIILLNPNHYPEAGTRRLRPWLAPLVAALAPEAESLGVRFVGDREMRRVNRQFRGKDKT